MQIILASAKIMNDKVKSSPDISLSSPRFKNEADCFARDMAQYSAETIAEMLGCSQQIATQNRMRYMRFFENAPKLPAILAYRMEGNVELPSGEGESYEGFTYEPKLGEPDYPHFIKR